MRSVYGQRRKPTGEYHLWWEQLDRQMEDRPQEETGGDVCRRDQCWTRPGNWEVPHSPQRRESSRKTCSKECTIRNLRKGQDYFAQAHVMWSNRNSQGAYGMAIIDASPSEEKHNAVHLPWFEGHEWTHSTVDAIATPMKGAKHFSICNVREGFWHVEFDESSPLTAFQTQFGPYRWCRMPFGLNSAPDDFLVYGRVKRRRQLTTIMTEIS